MANKKSFIGFHCEQAIRDALEMESARTDMSVALILRRLLARRFRLPVPRKPKKTGNAARCKRYRLNQLLKERLE